MTKLYRKVIVTALLCSTAVSVSLYAENTDSLFYRMDEIEVTASRIKTTLPNAVRITNVMTADEIATYPIQSVNDILKYAVSVDVRQRGPMGAQTDVGIRGGNFEQVAILLDGINICDPQTGHNSFDFPVDMSDIVHIEVLEGPAGRAYGSSSLMGAINIVTKTLQGIRHRPMQRAAATDMPQAE